MTEVTQADKDTAAWFTRRMEAGKVYQPYAERIIADYRIRARKEALEEAARVAEEWFPSGTESRYPSFGVVAAIRNLARFPTDK